MANLKCLALAAGPIMFALAGSAMARDVSSGAEVYSPRGLLAEMMAFNRESADICRESLADDIGGTSVRALYMAAAKDNPTEDEVEAKQTYLKDLLAKNGKREWCALYHEDMGVAKPMLDVAKQISMRRDPDRHQS